MELINKHGEIIQTKDETFVAEAIEHLLTISESQFRRILIPQLSDWENNFLNSIMLDFGRQRKFSEKQISRLKIITEKVAYDH